MACNRIKRTSGRLIQVLPILILSLAIIQTAQLTHAQTTDSPWALKLQILNSQNSTASVFNPFDQIQLCAMVTYNNASQPDVLVTFSVVGPSANSTSYTDNPIKIVRIEMTQANGEADFSFRLPIEAQNEDAIIGTWNVTATISGAQPQSSSFTTQWSLQTTAIRLLNSQGQNQTVFHPGSTVPVQVEINNQGPAQPANVTLSLQYTTGQIINQTEIINTQISSSNQTQIKAALQIPLDATAGQAAINVALSEETYNGTEIPTAENQTAYFTIASSTTAPTPSPTPTSTPSPTFGQNTVGLFSWLLVATGLFTFAALYMFLKRKPTKLETQLPSMPPTIPSPTLSTMSPAQPSIPQETTQPPTSTTTQTQQPPATAVALASRVAQEKTMRATVAAQADMEQTPLMQEKPAAVIEAVEESAVAYPVTEEPAPQPMLTRVSRVQSTLKRIQAIKSTLESEKKQLAQELAELDKTVNEREKAFKSYFDSVRGEMGKMQTYLTDREENTPEKQAKYATTGLADKTDLEFILTKQNGPQVISTKLSRIASLKKRIESLETVLKLEKEGITYDFSELNKTVNEQEKAVKNHFDMVKEEIRKLQTYLADEEDQTNTEKNEANNQKTTKTKQFFTQP